MYEIVQLRQDFRYSEINKEIQGSSVNSDTTSDQTTDYTLTKSYLRNLKEQDTVVGPRKYFGAESNKNVIMIQFESLQNFLINKKINGQEVTPNLNKLAEESIYFSKFFQQTGGGNTSDAEWLANTGFYPPGDKPAFKVFMNQEIPSLPRLLNERGYKTVTFHADEINFWNRINMYPALGYSSYYDIRYFGEDDAIGMGGSDKELFTKTLKKLQEYRDKNIKYYANIITLTSHNPFKIPTEDQTLHLPSNFEETNFGNYLQAIHYSDRMLGKFIKDLKASGIWDNSVLIVYGDHAGFGMRQSHQKELGLVKEFTGREYNYVDRLNIPLIIHSSNLPPTEISNIGGQVDIMPTVCNLLGIPLMNHVNFGSDLLNHKKNLLGVPFTLPTGSFIRDKYIFVRTADETQNNLLVNINTYKTKEISKVLEMDEPKYIKYTDNINEILELCKSYLTSLPALNQEQDSSIVGDE